MKRFIAVTISLLAGLLLYVAPAAAHVPYFTSTENRDAAHALPLPDTRISRVVYAELPCDVRAAWVSVLGQAGTSLALQLGIPVLDELMSYRPAVALVGPGLPPAPSGLPFEVPAGQGALLFATNRVETPKRFHEEYSNTDSWVLLETTQPLPSTGKYYLIVFDPTGPLGRAGRLWIATGTEERVDPRMVQQVLPRVQAFFRAPARGQAALGAACEEAQEPESPLATGGGGCSVAGGGGGQGWGEASLLVLVLAAVGGRVRSRRRCRLGSRGL
ncbi:MAG TPA: hypothetical protein VH877_26300 [Polyangia bacterium]|jgi:hypothetical protein|nr:hypothetical protein [Polyangia bacterium]